MVSGLWEKEQPLPEITGELDLEGTAEDGI